MDGHLGTSDLQGSHCKIISGREGHSTGVGGWEQFSTFESKVLCPTLVIGMCCTHCGHQNPKIHYNVKGVSEQAKGNLMGPERGNDVAYATRAYQQPSMMTWTYQVKRGSHVGTTSVPSGSVVLMWKGFTVQPLNGHNFLSVSWIEVKFISLESSRRVGINGGNSLSYKKFEILWIS